MAGEKLTKADLFAMPMGFRIIEDRHLTIGPLEDWSGVRSKSRAKRRRRAGHRQNIRLYWTPDPNAYRFGPNSLVMHPATATRLRQALKDQETHNGD